MYTDGTEQTYPVDGYGGATVPGMASVDRRDSARRQAQQSAQNSVWWGCYASCCGNDKLEEVTSAFDSTAVLDDRAPLAGMTQQQQQFQQQQMLQQQQHMDQQRLEQMQREQMEKQMQAHAKPHPAKLNANAQSKAAAEEQRRKLEEADEQYRLEKARMIAEQRAAEAAALEAQRRQALGELAHPGACMQVQLDSGWANMSDDEFKQVCDHIAGGEKRFSIQARGVLYIMDFSVPGAGKQINSKTMKARPVRVAFQ